MIRYLLLLSLVGLTLLAAGLLTAAAALKIHDPWTLRCALFVAGIYASLGGASVVLLAMAMRQTLAKERQTAGSMVRGSVWPVAGPGGLR